MVPCSNTKASTQQGAKVVDYMRGPGVSQFADEPGQTTLFKYAHGFDKIFGMLEVNPEQKEAFDEYMAARRLVQAPQWFEIYPAAQKLGERTVAGIGAASRRGQWTGPGNGAIQAATPGDCRQDRLARSASDAEPDRPSSGGNCADGVRLLHAAASSGYVMSRDGMGADFSKTLE